MNKTESQPSKRQQFIEKLSKMNSENDRLQAEVLRMMNSSRFTVPSRPLGNRQSSEELLKMLRQINEKTVIEKRKNKIILTNIRKIVQKSSQNQVDLSQYIPLSKHKKIVE